jgi:hypothetical protein
MTSKGLPALAAAALTLCTLAASGSARAEEHGPAALAAEPLVPLENCPLDPRHPHAMRCLSSWLVPKSYAGARTHEIAPFSDPPDAGAGVDASDEIGSCNGKPVPHIVLPTPHGLTPPGYNQAYNIPSAALAPGKIVAIVDACSGSSVVADLAAYREEFGLPPLPQCGGADGYAPTPGGPPCFGVVSQRGDGALPSIDSGWAPEIAIDVELASVGCPECSILLVEADTPNLWDLAPAVAEAITLGASAVSNSYGTVEDPTDPYGAAYSDGPYAGYYQHDGVLITAASGDGAYKSQLQPGGNGALGPCFPSSLPSVLSVGATYLTPSASSSRGFDEVVAEGSTSGCSTEFAKPPYQSGIETGSCAMRADVDVAAPGAQVGIYIAGAWQAFNGTSCSSPFIAGLFTHLGVAGEPHEFFYANPQAFFDLDADGGTGGNNDPSHTCTDVMCNTGPGWDGPSGLGSPNGLLIALLTDAGLALGLDAAVPNDASSDDGGADASGDGGPKGGTGASSGCGCGIVGSSPASPVPGGSVLAVVGATLSIRRRRRRRLAGIRAGE